MPKVKKKKREAPKTPSQLSRYTCFCCFEEKLETMFYKANSEVYYKIPACKDCMSKKFLELVQIDGDKFIALYKFCELYDIVFDKNLADGKINSGDSVTFMRHYITKINSLVQYKGLRFKDTKFNDVTDVSYRKEETDTELEKNVLLWDKGYTKTQYIILNDTLKKLKKTYPCDDEGSLIVLVQICKLKLQQSININNGTYDIKIDDALRKWLSQADSLKASSDKSESEIGLLGVKIKEIEKTKPAEFFKDKKLYLDFDGIKKYCEDFFLRPLSNLLKGTRDFNISDNDNVFNRTVDKNE